MKINIVTLNLIVAHERVSGKEKRRSQEHDYDVFH